MLYCSVLARRKRLRRLNEMAPALPPQGVDLSPCANLAATHASDANRGFELAGAKPVDGKGASRRYGRLSDEHDTPTSDARPTMLEHQDHSLPTPVDSKVASRRYGRLSDEHDTPTSDARDEAADGDVGASGPPSGTVFVKRKAEL